METAFTTATPYSYWPTAQTSRPHSKVRFQLSTPSPLLSEYASVTPTPSSMAQPKLLLLGRITSDWVMLQPFLVTLEQEEDGYWVASDDLFQVYGDGDTAEAARQDYIVALIDYYQILALKAEADPHSEGLFRHLQHYLRPLA